MIIIQNHVAFFTNLPPWKLAGMSEALFGNDNAPVIKSAHFTIEFSRDSGNALETGTNFQVYPVWSDLSRTDNSDSRASGHHIVVDVFDLCAFFKSSGMVAVNYLEEKELSQFQMQ